MYHCIWETVQVRNYLKPGRDTWVIATVYSTPKAVMLQITMWRMRRLDFRTRLDKIWVWPCYGAVAAVSDMQIQCRAGHCVFVKKNRSTFERRIRHRLLMHWFASGSQRPKPINAAGCSVGFRYRFITFVRRRWRDSRHYFMSSLLHCAAEHDFMTPPLITGAIGLRRGLTSRTHILLNLPISVIGKLLVFVVGLNIVLIRPPLHYSTLCRRIIFLNFYLRYHTPCPAEVRPKFKSI